jgi:hypothetical protein
LRFIAEKGNDNQLAYVEKIHVAKEVYSVGTNNNKYRKQASDEVCLFVYVCACLLV